MFGRLGNCRLVREGRNRKEKVFVFFSLWWGNGRQCGVTCQKGVCLLPSQYLHSQVRKVLLHTKDYSTSSWKRSAYPLFPLFGKISCDKSLLCSLETYCISKNSYLRDLAVPLLLIGTVLEVPGGASELSYRRRCALYWMRELIREQCRIGQATLDTPSGK